MGRASRGKRARRKAGQAVLPPEPRSLLLKQQIPIRRSPSAAGRKVSECLIELIDPFVQDRMPGDHFRILVAAGAMAWNLAALPVDDRARELAEILGAMNLDTELRNHFLELVDELRRRKQSLFPQDDRFIASWDVKDLGNGRYYLTAASLKT